jgi:malonate decarboxylase delta subunit
MRSTICGVVSSGNLEILVEPNPSRNVCTVVVNTSAHGFRDIWEAVLHDFALRHAAGGLGITINDAGATPAVVSLRLDQAFEIYWGETK